MSLWDQLIQNQTTVIAYSLFFTILALTLPFIGLLGRKIPSLSEKKNLLLARICLIIGIAGIILTVAISFLHKYLGIVDFIPFAVITFVFPLLLGAIMAFPFYLTKQNTGNNYSLLRAEGRRLDDRNSAEIFIIYAAFGVVASNFHDVLWCGEITHWFTTTAGSGGELQIWVDIVGATSDTYEFFGFFMLLHVIFCGLLATFMLWRYTRRYKEGLLKNPNSRSSFLLAWIGSLLWGYGLYLMDSLSRQSSIAWFMGTFLWIPLGIFILALSAKYLSRFEGEKF